MFPLARVLLMVMIRGGRRPNHLGRQHPDGWPSEGVVACHGTRPSRGRGRHRRAARINGGDAVEFFKKSLDPIVALAIIAVFDIFLFQIVGAWTVGGGETMIAGLFVKALVGAKEMNRIPFWRMVFKPTWAYWKIYISLGMGFGALVSAILSKEFYWRVPKHLSEWVMITIGGLLMGVGIRLSFVCNVSTFLGLTPEMNLGGYLAVSGLVIGAWVGTWVYKKILEA